MVIRTGIVTGRFVMRTLGLILLMVLIASGVAAESRFGSRPWKGFLEFDQMFVLKAGAERSLTQNWGIEGALGVSLMGFTTFGYELVGVYHLRPERSRFQWDIEFGLPIAYFNFLEGTVVDLDPYASGPYAGWAPGACLVWGFRFRRGSILGVKTGAVVPIEYQWGSGWSGRLQVIPDLALQWMF